MKKWVPSLLGLLLAVAASAQIASKPEVLALPRLKEARLPLYPSIAETAHITGKVIVLVTVKGGRVVKTDVQSGSRLLKSPTVSNLKTWRFAAGVDATFTVTYAYEISGEETGDPTNPRVEMLPSLDVNIVARPFKPTCSGCRPTETALGSAPSQGARAMHEGGHIESPSK